MAARSRKPPAAPAAPPPPNTPVEIAEWARRNPVAAAKLALAARHARVVAARGDVNDFIEYVIRDEFTGHPIVQAPVHEEWHHLLDRLDKVLIWSHIESGKTNQLSISRVLYELGGNHNLRFLIVSNTFGQVEKIVGSIAGYIERSTELHEVFPDLLPGDEWTKTELRVRRQAVAKDPSVQGIGLHGNVLGARVDRLILDDILDYENTLTPTQREKVWNWLRATVFGRLTADARVWVLGTAFHPEDALHKIAELWGASRWRRFPAVDREGTPTWPVRWSAARLAEAKVRLGPLEFARQLLCIARDDSDARFKKEWVDLCLKRGKGRSMAYALDRSALPGNYRVFTGVDLAVQQHAAADRTAMVTVLIHPNGDREILDIVVGRWTGPEIIERIVAINQRYGSIIIVENNAAQDYILQFTRHQSAVTVKPFTTGRNKAHPEFGVESLAAEMAAGKWIYPNEGGITPELDLLIRGMLYYDAKGHTSDLLMAKWFAREGARMGAPKAERGRIDLLRR